MEFHNLLSPSWFTVEFNVCFVIDSDFAFQKREIEYAERENEFSTLEKTMGNISFEW